MPTNKRIPVKNKPIVYGGIGTFVTGLCCFTPILVIGVVAAGAASIVAYLDYVLFPMLGFFIFLTIYGVIRARRQSCAIETAAPQKRA